MSAEDKDRRKRACPVTAADADEQPSQRFHGTDDDAVNEDELVPQPADGIILAEEKTVAEDTPDEVMKAEMEIMESPVPVPLAGALPVLEYVRDDDDEDDDEDEALYTARVPGRFLSENTPTKRGHQKPPVGVWTFIKRLRDLHAALLGGREGKADARVFEVLAPAAHVVRQ